MSRPKRTEWTFAVQQSVGGRVRWHGGDPRRWLSGAVLTPYGIVDVYSQGHNDSREARSGYTFVHNGRAFMMTECVARSQRGLATIAGRFARRIAARNPR